MTQPARAAAPKPLVFISYSHKDEVWNDRLSEHLGVLEQHGYLVQWHDRKIDAGDDWLAEIERAMARASVAVLLVSPSSLTSGFILRNEVTELLRRRDQEGLRIFPVVVRPVDFGAVPWLAKMQLRPKDARAISGGNDYQIDTDLAEITKEIRLLLGRVGGPALAGLPPRPTGPEIDIRGLPVTGRYLFGRELELELVDGAWFEPKTDILSLVAAGGVGKTALIKRWLDRIAPKYHGAARVYGWSFFSQGTRETETSADEFVNSALRWFGDPDPTAGHAAGKTDRLVRLIRQAPTLLILDGLEPLQNPPGPDAGRLKDPALADLLVQLASFNPGLCIVTTRIAVEDLADFPETAPVIALDHLSDAAGAQLLRTLGVQGEPEELEQGSHEYRGHSLALNLLGTFIRDMLGGDVRRRGEVSLREQDAERGGQARRVMASYERWLGEGPEVATLYLLGLFDRPARRELIDELRKPPAIPGLTDRLVGISEARWQRALARLRQARLLEVPDPAAPGALDTHPLVREHFGEELRERNPEAWRAGHGRLYEHLKATPDLERPSLEEMAPLFQAVFHGCQAGRHQEVLNEVYWARISRRDEEYVIKKLGAFGADLAALAVFFEGPWRTPVATITEADQSWVLGQAGYRLRALGRLREALPPMQAALEVAVKREDWAEAARRAGNLSELHLALGEVGKAAAWADKGAAHAEQSGDAFLRLVLRTALADAQHQAGERERSLALFEEVEQIQEQRWTQYPLYSLRGFQYCDLLLDLGGHLEVRERAAQTLSWAERDEILVEIALDHLSLGRAELLAWQADRNGDLDEAAKQLNQAVDGLRQAGSIHHVPRGLLARAALYRLTGDEALARRDLAKAIRIAQRCEMRLFECDARLESSRLELALGNPDKARHHAAAAKRLIAATGYHRRDAELADVESRLCQL